MDVDGFWALIAAVESPGELHQRLLELSGTELADFSFFYDRADWDAYSWELWDAARIIGDGCGDDAFDDFRAYLISRGREVFAAALAEPDSLADVELDRGDGWKEWLCPALVVADSHPDKQAFLDAERFAVPRSVPTGLRREDTHLAERFPRLAARYDW